MEQAEKRQQAIIEEFSQLSGWEERYKNIMKFLVKGCQSQVWMHAHLNDDKKMILEGDSDAMIVKGLVALLLRAYSGLTPQEILKSSPKFIEELGFKDHLSPSRANGFLSMLKQIHLYAQAFTLTAN